MNAFGMSNIYISLSSFVSTTYASNTDSFYVIVIVTSSLVIFSHCGLLSATHRPLIDPSLFSLINKSNPIDFSFSSFFNSTGIIGLKVYLW